MNRDQLFVGAMAPAAIAISGWGDPLQGITFAISGLLLAVLTLHEPLNASDSA